MQCATVKTLIQNKTFILSRPDSFQSSPSEHAAPEEHSAQVSDTEVHHGWAAGVRHYGVLLPLLTSPDKCANVSLNSIVVAVGILSRCLLV